MNTEQERADFEGWFRTQWTVGYGCPKDADGSYVDPTAQLLWEAYQAGRAATQSHPMDADHWAELHRLRAERGPSGDGHETWRDAAIAERKRRVAAEKSLQSQDREDAARWRYAMDWETKDFAVCRRVGDTGACWEPIKTSGPIDHARRIEEDRGE